MNDFKEHHSDMIHPPTPLGTSSPTDSAAADGINSASGITRKEAIKRMGKYAAVTALGAYIIMNPMKAQAASATTPPSPDGNGGITPSAPLD
jgi:hypothetical protein